MVAALVLASLHLVRRRHDSVRWPGIKRVVASADRVSPVPARSSRRRPWLLLLACAATIVALARPQWGRIEREAAVRAREVMLAIDLSRSMLVEDVPPSRLERSKLLVRGLLDGLAGERVGLIVFAGTAFVQVPMSADYQILEEFLPELTPAYMPQGGTDYAGMLQSALEGFGTVGETDRYLVVLSDGEAHDDSWMRLLPELQKRNVRVVALGVGTAEGGFIPDGAGGFVKDSRGAVVLSRLENGTLRALARDTNGLYRDAAAWVDLNALLEESVRLGRQGDFTEETTIEHIERFQWPLAVAVALALLGLWREVSARPRSRSIAPVSTSTRQPSTARPTTRGTRVGRPTPTALGALVVALHLAAPESTFLVAQQPAALGPSEEEPPPDARIREVVTRLAHARRPRAEDWRDLAAHTLDLGEGLLAAGARPPRGPLLDALAAVEEGRTAAPAIADWDALRSRLLDMLQAPPPESNDQGQDQDERKSDASDDEQKQQQEDEASDSSRGDQSKEDSDDGRNEGREDSESTPQESDQRDSEKGGAGDDAESESRRDSDDASGDGTSGDSESGGKDREASEPSRPASEQGRLGDLQDSPTPDADPASLDQEQDRPSAEPPPRTRKFGGRPSSDTSPPPTDPEMAAALQRLRRATDQDSPARLFQLIEGDKKDTASGGKDW
ncbi:VWA domain-containing protein [Congregicoccus parvus]|uniref:VWA domain-containing protein n=1 Tax=Congregicoccus parvus TaxID=3081749 RepID=UPI003FA5298E